MTILPSTISIIKFEPLEAGVLLFLVILTELLFIDSAISGVMALEGECVLVVVAIGV